MSEGLPISETLAKSMAECRGRAKKVLLVEDDESDAFITADELAQHGYEVTRVQTGQEAIAEDRSNFDMSVIDLCLGPKSMPGIDVAILLSQKYHQMVIVICSGYVEAINALPEALRRGFIIVEKPFKMAVLNRVGNALNARA